MAQTKTLNARLALKYDLLSNWIAESNQFILKRGEIAIAEIPAVDPANKQNPPVMFKVGDGEKTFNQLDWASALAADVYSWAKAAGLSVDAASIADGQYVTGLKWENDTLKITTSALITDVANNGESLKAATTKAVKEYVDSEVQKAVSGGVEGLATEEYVDNAITTLTNGAVKNAADAASTAQTKANEAYELADTKATLADVETAGYAKTADVVTNEELTQYDTSVQATYATKEALKATDDIAKDAQSKIDTFMGTIESDTEAVDTLKEIVDLIGAEDAASGLLADVAQLKEKDTTLQGEIDANETAIGTINTTIGAYGDIVSHNASEFATAAQGAKADTAVQPAALEGYKQVQEAVAEVGAANQTLKISQDVQGKITATPVDIAIAATQVSGLANIATTGNVNDLIQTSGDYILFDCGSATTLID